MTMYFGKFEAMLALYAVGFVLFVTTCIVGCWQFGWMNSTAVLDFVLLSLWIDFVGLVLWYRGLYLIAQRTLTIGLAPQLVAIGIATILQNVYEYVDLLGTAAGGSVILLIVGFLAAWAILADKINAAANQAPV